ncbi:MAG TPA: hypothetical protein VJ808_02590, partial [Gemmatimonadales bacterium]|nr:hypothetical protein [Gemmatimonadales bacterium]
GRRAKAKRRNAAAPVRLALGVVPLYMVVMALSGRAARGIVAAQVAGSDAGVRDIMAGPVPLDPFVRTFVLEEERQYRVGTFRWLDRPHVNLSQVLTFPRGQPSHPAVAAAVESAQGRRFLGWARYPTFEIQRTGNDRFLVHVIDLRYARERGESFGAISIPVTLPTASTQP